MPSIPTFPSVAFLMATDTNGTITSNGTATSIAANTAEQLRLGVIAYTAKVARRAGRPVELTIRGDTNRYQVAVHPDGYTQEIGKDRTVPDAPTSHDRQVARGLCRSCKRIALPSYNFCCYCRTENPLTRLQEISA